MVWHFIFIKRGVVIYISWDSVIIYKKVQFLSLQHAAQK